MSAHSGDHVGMPALPVNTDAGASRGTVTRPEGGSAATTVI